MDMLANVPSGDAPEIESLGGNDLIDVYRQFAGPANLAGSRVVSNELGASRGEAYSQTITDVIWSVKRSIAGSVNQMVYHIYPWSGQYPNTTYPGYTVFTYLFSAMHGPRQPAWVFYGDFMNWTARTQYIAQSGVPKVDLAIWLKDTSFATLSNKYLPSDLEAAGKFLTRFTNHPTWLKLCQASHTNTYPLITSICPKLSLARACRHRKGSLSRPSSSGATILSPHLAPGS
jgi:hypothetical protein